MGTNYYLVKNDCSHCGRHEKIHIGKRSGGWMFSFHALIDNIPHVRSWKDWKQEIKNSSYDKPIVNEYGERFTFDEFESIVNATRNEKLNHYDYCMENYPEWRKKSANSEAWKDIDGWSFSVGEFS